MDDLDSIVGPGWNTLLAKFEVKTRGFERQYSELRKLPGAADDLASFDEVLREYFQELELPPSPTIYDYLVLGLRRKDLIGDCPDFCVTDHGVKQESGHRT